MREDVAISGIEARGEMTIPGIEMREKVTKPGIEVREKVTIPGIEVRDEVSLTLHEPLLICWQAAIGSLRDQSICLGIQHFLHSCTGTIRIITGIPWPCKASGKTSVITLMRIWMRIWILIFIGCGSVPYTDPSFQPKAQTLEKVLNWLIFHTFWLCHL